MDYKNYKHIVYRVAHNLSRNADELEEMISLGNEVYMKAVNKYDENRNAKFSTFLYVLCKNAMINSLYVLRREHRHASIENITEAYESASTYRKRREGKADKAYYLLPSNTNMTPEREYLFVEQLSTLSKEAQKAVKLIFDSPGEIISNASSLAPKMLRSALIKKMRKDNWSWPKIWRVFGEIRMLLSVN